jgi:hypothetical protein
VAAGAFAYLGYGYFDDGHGAVTLLFLPVFAVGLSRVRTLAKAGRDAPPASLLSADEAGVCR